MYQNAGRAGVSNEDGYLFWTHRGVSLVLHSQDDSNPSIPHQVRGVLAFSPDTNDFDEDSWVISSRPAYNASIYLSNGTTLTAKRRQRPQMVFDGFAYPSSSATLSSIQSGTWPKRTPTHLSNAVDLDFGENADGWGDAWASLVPLAKP